MAALTTEHERKRFALDLEVKPERRMQTYHSSRFFFRLDELSTIHMLAISASRGIVGIRSILQPKFV